MTSQSPRLKGDSVSPYLLMALRDAPKPLAEPPRTEPPGNEPKTVPDQGVEQTAPTEGAYDDVPPLARPGLKL